MKNILIADDRPEIRTLVRITLSSDGYQVTECQSAPEAVALARQSPLSCIIMDIDMPGEYDGLTAIQKLHADPATADIPVIMLTGSKKLQDKSLQAGAVAYLTKPFSPIDLLKNIQQAAQRS